MVEVLRGFVTGGNDDGGTGNDAIVGSEQIVAMGPVARIEIPLFG